jgi:hypothetical protein
MEKCGKVLLREQIQTILRWGPRRKQEIEEANDYMTASLVSGMEIRQEFLEQDRNRSRVKVVLRKSAHFGIGSVVAPRIGLACRTKLVWQC